MRPRYNNVKRPKFAGKFSRGPQIQEKALLKLRSNCLWEYTQKLSDSRKGAVGA